MTGINPTPITEDEAWKHLLEEAADVYCVLGLLLGYEEHAEIYNITKRKKARWARRLAQEDNPHL